MHAQGAPEGVSGKKRNAIGRPSGVPGGRRNIGSGDEGMFGLVVNGKVEWASRAESTGLTFLD